MVLCARSGLVFIVLAFVCLVSEGQDEVTQPRNRADTKAVEKTAAKTIVKTAAKVAEWEIAESRVDRHLENAIGKRELSVDLLKRARAHACEQLVRRQVVYEYVKKYCPVPESEIRSELSILEANLAKVDQSIEDHLRKTRMSLAELKNEIVWKVAWGAYLKKKITEQSMKQYFQRNRKWFDGTEIRVAHILFKKSDEVAIQMDMANNVRESIGAGETSWADAVQANSIATVSKKSAGDIGWIRYNEPMPTGFTKVAFQLELEQISEPVPSAFGIHLIKCLEIKAGKTKLADVEDELRGHMTRFLFDRIADKHRDDVEISYAEGFALAIDPATKVKRKKKARTDK